MKTIHLQHSVDAACRHLLSQLDRDPCSMTLGCFDRRYWAWKLTDFPEATFQRGIHALAWKLERVDADTDEAGVLAQAVQSGLLFTARIQHKNGSFDQAFPHEQSFGATAFLLSPILTAYAAIRNTSDAATRKTIERCCRTAADFICMNDERHGVITNHVAGAAVALFMSADAFGQAQYEKRAQALLNRVLASQSNEGWFPEYGGADPGYQSLCLQYLAQAYQLRPSDALLQALKKSVIFLSWFVHPDGTFAGEYGSRRTAIFYPGGFAMLADEIPMAGSILAFMLEAIQDKRTTTLTDVDMGNLAPLLTSNLAVLDADLVDGPTRPSLPWTQHSSCQDFPGAGLFVRGTRKHYTILGGKNGGVLKVFDKSTRRILLNDAGYIATLSTGMIATTQGSDGRATCLVTENKLQVTAPFSIPPRKMPTPVTYVVLRLLNLTVMRNVRVGNIVKRALARALMKAGRSVPLIMERVVDVEEEQITITDTVKTTARTSVKRLTCGAPFVAIHMASARYFQNMATDSCLPKEINTEDLNATGRCTRCITV